MGMYIKVRVKPNAKIESVIKKTEDHFVVSVREKAERNMANKRVIEIIAGVFKVPVTKARIVSGHHSPSKIVSVDVS